MSQFNAATVIKQDIDFSSVESIGKLAAVAIGVAKVLVCGITRCRAEKKASGPSNDCW